jgi:hypothetical protein
VSTPENPTLPTAAARPRAVIVLLAVGVALYALAGNDMPAIRWAIVLGAVGLSLIPPVNRALARLLDRIRNPSRRAQEWAGVLIAVAATAYLIATAFAQGRGLTPKTHDDCSYVIAARMLAHGRLWMPQHQLADFFESFYLLVKPVYCSIYFPGTALMFAPMEWLGWATWILPVVLSGAAVGLLYRVVTEAVDGVSGALAAVWMVSLTWFRTISILVMSHVAMVLLGLLIVWAWLRWRRQRRWGWAIAVGALCGWAAITRPADAVAYAVPVGVAMAAALWRRSAREWAVTAACLVLAAAPFLALQVVFNFGVTGRPLRTPYTAYLERDQPGTQFGVRPYDPSARPVSSLPQKRAYYDWARPFFEQHQPHNFYKAWVFTHEVGEDRVLRPHLLTLADSTTPNRLLLVLLPVALLALRRAPAAVVAATAPVFVLLYIFNPFFLEHYPIVVAPAIVVCVGVGCAAVGVGFPRWLPQIRVAAAMLVLALSVTSLWQVKRYMPELGKVVKDGFGEGSVLAVFNDAVDSAIRGPAVVLFRAPPQFFAEAVYNTDVAWPDDARIVRAHDLGARDIEIVEYYAGRSPDRDFYLVDWTGRGVVPLGDAKSLLARLRSGATVESIVKSKP